MVGKIVGAAAFLSLIALVWLMAWLAHWQAWSLLAAAVLFIIIGAFAALDPSEWRKKDQP